MLLDHFLALKRQNLAMKVKIWRHAAKLVPTQWMIPKKLKSETLHPRYSPAKGLPPILDRVPEMVLMHSAHQPNPKDSVWCQFEPDRTKFELASSIFEFLLFFTVFGLVIRFWLAFRHFSTDLAHFLTQSPSH